MEKQGFGSHSTAELIRSGSMAGKMAIGSRWEWEHWRDGKLISTWVEPNIMTDEGITYIMDSALSGASPITSWYVEVFENDYTPLSTNTYATPGFTACTAYDEATRPAWTEAGISSKIISNSASKATFTFNAGNMIYGGALVGGGSAASTKADAAGGGKLICSSQFTTGSKSVVSTDVLKVTVTITGSNVT